MSNWRKKLWLLFVPFLIFGCSPEVATPTLKCEASGVCTITVKNEESHPVKYHISLGYEPQGRAAVEEFRQVGKNAPKYHDYFRRNNSIFFSKDNTLEGNDTITFTTTLPKEFKDLPGYSLMTLYVQLDPPNGLSMAYGRYRAYSAYVVPGDTKRVVEYDLDCSGNEASITIRNNDEWRTLNFAAYLDEDMDTTWEKFTVGAGDTLTFTTKPFPAGAKLLEVDVEGHQMDTDWNGEADLFFHESRGMCIPNTPTLTLQIPDLIPFNPENR